MPAVTSGSEIAATATASPSPQPATPDAARHWVPRARLLIATNRQPFELARSTRGAHRQTTGGVTSALLPIVTGSDGKWVAGNTASRADGAALIRYFPNLRLVDISPAEFAAYYHGLSNSALWPLCHYFVDRCRFTLSDWEGYCRVNRKFAACLAEEYDDGDIVWVHDYHLCLVPELLRADLQNARIAYFHHIPFPPPDVFRILPWSAEILRGLLGADQVGFHTDSYKKNFIQACAFLDDVQVNPAADTVSFRDRTTHAATFPIGIDVQRIDQFAADATTKEDAARIRRELRVDKLLLGVDRLDYTKGIVQRFEAIDTLLETYPNLTGQIGLLQIAVPSRENVSEYRSLKRQVDELIGRINGKHAVHGWQPIHCTYRAYSPRQLVAYYRAADVALVTPVRDGMNLVAKEFCASRRDNDGVLVLSELAGAADQLGNAALLVNPFNIVAVAEAIRRAISMPADERRHRMSKLRRVVAASDVNRWVDAIIDPLVSPRATERSLRA